MSINTLNLPATTQAYCAREKQLRLIEHPVRPLESGEMLVRVLSFALNRADYYQLQGGYAPPQGETEILGLELCGEVIALHNSVTEFVIGQKIAALVGSGAFAEYAIVNVGLTFDASHLSPTMAAGLPEGLFTIEQNIFTNARLQPGETVLVHGASSGIGTLAVQMALLNGSSVLATTSSAKRERVVQLIQQCQEKSTTKLFTQIVNYQNDSFETEFQQKADVILDMIGGDYFSKNLTILKRHGRLVYIDSQTNPNVEINLLKLIRNNWSIMGSVLRSQSLDYKIALREKINSRWWPRVQKGELTCIVDSVYKFNEIEEAFKRLLSPERFGKVIVTLESA